MSILYKWWTLSCYVLLAYWFIDQQDLKRLKFVKLNRCMHTRDIKPLCYSLQGYQWTPIKVDWLRCLITNSHSNCTCKSIITNWVIEKFILKACFIFCELIFQCHVQLHYKMYWSNLFFWWTFQNWKKKKKRRSINYQNVVICI